MFCENIAKSFFLGGGLLFLTHTVEFDRNKNSQSDKIGF